MFADLRAAGLVASILLSLFISQVRAPPPRLSGGHPIGGGPSESSFQPIPAGPADNSGRPKGSADFAHIFQYGLHPDFDNGFHVTQPGRATQEVDAYYKTWGYRESATDEPVADDLTDFADAKKLKGDWKWVEISHDNEFNSKGNPNGEKDGQPSDAYFRTSFMKTQGILSAEDARSPRIADPELDSYPKLEHWSNVNWLGWVKQEPRTAEANRALNGVNWYHVNDESATLNIIKRKMGFPDSMTQGELAARLKPWPADDQPIPGQTFPFGQESDPGKDIMRGPHGRGVGYLIAEHQNPEYELGKKTIASWTPYQSTTLTGEKKVNLFFEIKPLDNTGGTSSSDMGIFGAKSKL